MIRLAICDPRAKARSILREAFHSLADEAGVVPYATRRYATLAAATDAFSERRPGYCALLLCNVDYLQPDDAVFFEHFKERFPRTRLLVASANPDMAMRAYQVHADGFMSTAQGIGEFRRIMKEHLDQIAAQRSATITLKTRDGIDVLDANRILFAETSDNGPIIHLAEEQDVQTRGTLQSLFDQMSHDKRFIKAGGSFIVNLDNVRSAGKSSVVFPDGSLVIIPIRARKPFQEALDSYRAG